MSALLFSDMVAVVTGSGGGLGRTYALELAKRGAKVIVNDLGSYKDGEGNSFSPATQVVKEINDFGGIAFPNFDSVENGDKIIEFALKKFGKIDILINNAGITRDISFVKMTDAYWNSISKVHLFGAYKTTHAAWSHMRNQKFGRIIFTSSSSGLYGNFGQSNYSAAKLGLVGFCKTLALEGSQYDILCNTIVPIASSRLTEDVLSPDVLKSLPTEYVSPLVLYLCHPSTKVTGGLFEVGAGWIGSVRWEVTKGVVLAKKIGSLFTPEDVRDNWQQIVDFTGSRHPSSTIDYAENITQIIKERSANTMSKTVNPQLSNMEDIIGYSKTNNSNEISFRDAILYAISVGVNNSKVENLKFLYENHDRFSVLPSFAVILSLNNAIDLLKQLDNEMDFTLDFAQTVHFEQYFELFEPLKINENYSSTAEIVDVLDKNRSAIIIINVNLHNSENKLISTTQISLYVKGAGGFNGKSHSEKVFVTKIHPDRKPDVTVEQYIDPNQTALYRLNGDFNPLHIDPEFSKLAGYPIPILHGLCSFSIVAQIGLCMFGNGNVEQFKKMKVRFSKPVIPGQTLIIEFWLEGLTVYFQAKVKETGEICLMGGYMEINEEQVIPRL